MSRTQPASADSANTRLNQLVRTLFVAMGFATIFFMWIIKPAVEPNQDALYHWSGSAWSFFLPAAFDFLLLWLLLALLLLAARGPGRRRAVIWGALLFFAPWFLSQTLQQLSLIPTSMQLDRVLFLSALLATILFALRWRPTFAPRLDRIASTAGTILVFAGLFGLFMLAQLAFRSWQAHRFMRTFPLHQRVATAAQPHRIIWVVLDELSYQQTFERRFPGLKLPAFDALAATSTNFTQARPFDIYTEIVLPGLLSGKPFDQMHITSTVQLSVHNKLTGKWQPFDQHDTVFQDALNDGYNTAVVGWYNPYCRIVPGVLDRCYWTNGGDINLMVPGNSSKANVLAPIKLLAWMVLNVAPSRIRFYCMNRLHIPDHKQYITQMHINDYVDLDARSQQLLNDRSFGFVLLHLPVPHPWGIYDRHTGRFVITGSSYINNLALADMCLAGIRRTLEQTGQWDSSTVVVMGDHSWRTQPLWHLPRLGYAWSQEDETASRGGQYDPRPAYLVKLPGQTTSARIDAPYRTVNTRQLFDAIMAHQINTPADLAAWAQSLPAPH